MLFHEINDLTSQQSVINRVNYLRKQATGGDVMRAIELPPNAEMSVDDKRLFMHFNIYREIEGKLIEF